MIVDTSLGVGSKVIRHEHYWDVHVRQVIDLEVNKCKVEFRLK